MKEYKVTITHPDGRIEEQKVFADSPQEARAIVVKAVDDQRIKVGLGRE